MSRYVSKICEEQNLKPDQVQATIKLLDDGSSIPFIARYRKEATDSLDEIVLTAIRDRLHQLQELDKRRVTIFQTIEQQGKLTPALKDKIANAETMAVLEDLYLPYKPKRRTKATVAKEKGLELLASQIFDQEGLNVELEAVKFVDHEKGVESTLEAIAGARDIIAEWINENGEVREKLRALFREKGVLQSKVLRGKDEEGVNYRDYYDWEELARTAPSHRILATRRGEREKILMVRIVPPEEEALKIIIDQFVRSDQEDSKQVELAAMDSYKRLLSLSLETESRMELKKRADQEAITVFRNNLRELLMAPPMGQKNVLAIDPGLRTGSKIVCLDKQGKLLHNTAVYLVQSEREADEAKEVIKRLCEKYKIEVIAIGHGTASRETESFVRLIGLDEKIQIVMVNESGASIYSASDIAREEFPNHDVTVRGAVSIGRRLMDPLAELVKLDAKSIGVGQYQHDVDQNLLKRSLDDCVMSCVNQVGVELNTASKQLLTYVSGLGPTRAQSIIDYRNEHGPFQSRLDLTTISKLGTKAFEQAAGFLRIFNGANPLDASSVHPEAYPIIDSMAADLGCKVTDLINHENYRKKISLKDYVTDQIGLPTLQDIKAELEKPGRDPREPFQIFNFKEGVQTMDDLTEGMSLPGVVTNVTAFGAFVDIGIHQDGLVHISQLSERFVKDPADIVKVHQQVKVIVLEVDKARRRIALTMRKKMN